MGTENVSGAEKVQAEKKRKRCQEPFPSWTVYDDIDNATFTAQGYATETFPGSEIWTNFTLVNPVQRSGDT